MKRSLPMDLLCVNMNLSVRCSWTEKWNFCLPFLITQHFQQFLSVCVPNLSPFRETPFWIHENSGVELHLLQNNKKKTKTWGQDRKPLLLSLWLFDSLLFQARNYPLVMYSMCSYQVPGWTNTYYVTNWVISWHFHRDQGIYNNWCSQLLH